MKNSCNPTPWEYCTCLGDAETNPQARVREPTTQGQATESKGSVETEYQALFQTSVLWGFHYGGFIFHDVLKEENVLAGAGKRRSLHFKIWLS